MENNALQSAGDEMPGQGVFYDEVVDLQSLTEELALVPMTDQEEAEILFHIDQVIHHEFIDAILSALPAEQHEEFLVLFAQDPASGEHWVYLERYIPDIRQRLSARLGNAQESLREIMRKHLN